MVYLLLEQQQFREVIMRAPSRYEKEVAKVIHQKQKSHPDWPFNSSVDYQNHLGEEEKLTGKQFVVVWQDKRKVFTKECGCVSELVDVPHTCLVITRHEVEARFYERYTNEWLVEEYP